MTHVDWHPFDYRKTATHPTERRLYLVTLKFSSAEKMVSSLLYYKDKKRFSAAYDGCIIAWAELPEPYNPEEPEDNHPDAITARKYAEGDPDTVKALHIFDE